MRKWIPLYLVFLLLLLVVPPAVAAEGEAGAPTDPAAIPAGRPHDPGYAPVEKRANDSGMATVTAVVFGAPVVIGLIARSIKRTKKLSPSTTPLSILKACRAAASRTESKSYKKDFLEFDLCFSEGPPRSFFYTEYPLRSGNRRPSS